MNASKRLAAWRQARGFTLEHCATLVSRSTTAWSDWEHGYRVPKADSTQIIEGLTRDSEFFIPMTDWVRVRPKARPKRAQPTARPSQPPPSKRVA